jgi:hypothetical protein
LTTAEARPEVTLPAHYVADNVELGYATTVHRAQGLTVEQAHVLAAPGMTREALYVGMTRGRAGNHVYVSTDAVDPRCNEQPDPGSVANGREVLERILNTDGTELSATQTLRRHQDLATSLATLEPIKATLLADADARKWQRLLPSCALSGDQVNQVLASPSAGALFAALRLGEQGGHPMPRVLAQLAAARSLDSPDDPVHDLAAVLHERVTRWLESDAPPVEEARVLGAPTNALRPSTLTTGSVDPDDPAFDTISEIDVLIRSRVEALTFDAIQTRPAWMQPLGEQPGTEPASRQWREAVTVVASYRDVNQITSVAALGVDRGGDETTRQQRRIAQRAETTALALTQSPTNDPITR